MKACNIVSSDVDSVLHCKKKKKALMSNTSCWVIVLENIILKLEGMPLADYKVTTIHKEGKAFSLELQWWWVSN